MRVIENANAIELQTIPVAPVGADEYVPRYATLHSIDDINNENWRENALCAEEGFDPDDFFPPQNRPVAAKISDTCKVCPVREPCLREALVNKEAYGYWGNTYPSQRERKVRNVAGQAVKGAV